MTAHPRIAVVLAGCGVQDGSEIHEAVLTLLALDRQGAMVQCFAPNIPQHDVINHLTGQPMSERRNVLIEAARIARGKIRDLATFKAAEWDGLVFPGGFGAVKNLCDYAMEGIACSVDPAVEKAVVSMHVLGHPIGALCISPVLIVRILKNVHVTIGNDHATSAAIGAMGGQHQQTGHGEVVIDREYQVVTTPCYMLNSTISQIAEGADNLIRALLGLIGERKS